MRWRTLPSPTRLVHVGWWGVRFLAVNAWFWRRPSAARDRARLRVALDASAALGGLFLKVAQIAAVAGLFDDVDAGRARGLLDRQRPVPARRVRRLVRRAARRAGDALVELDPSPLGSASIAVVHRATFRTRGPVVVKVRRPAAVRRYSSDLGIIGLLAARSAMGPLLWDFATVARRELDLGEEAAAGRLVAEWLDDLPTAVAVPAVDVDASDASVLVMGEVGGVRVDEADAGDEALQRAVADLATLLIAASATGRPVHTDPHPANLRWDGEHLWWLDWGQHVLTHPVAQPARHQDIADALVGRGWLATTLGAMDLSSDACGARSEEESLPASALDRDLLGPELLLLKSLFQLGQWAGKIAPTATLLDPSPLLDAALAELDLPPASTSADRSLIGLDLTTVDFGADAPPPEPARPPSLRLSLNGLLLLSGLVVAASVAVGVQEWLALSADGLFGRAVGAAQSFGFALTVFTLAAVLVVRAVTSMHRRLTRARTANRATRHGIGTSMPIGGLGTSLPSQGVLDS